MNQPIFVSGNNLAEAVYEAMEMLFLNGDLVEGENQNNVDELYDSTLIMTLLNPLGVDTYCIPKCLPGSLEDLKSYVDEFILGTKDGQFGYTYHGLYSKYLTSCLEELDRYRYTRRATLPIAGDDSYGTPYPPCLQLMLPRVRKTNRGDVMDLMAVFRSNDAVNAFPMNIFAIAMMQREFAKQFGCKVGQLTYIANSFHAYSKDWGRLQGYVFRWLRHYNKGVGMSNLAFSMKDYIDVCEGVSDE